MTDSVTDEDVLASRQRVDSLREDIAEEKARSSAIASSNENVIRKSALDAEAERLEAELAALKAANDPSAVEAQVAALTSQVDHSNDAQVVDTTPPPPPPLPTDDGPSADDN